MKVVDVEPEWKQKSTQWLSMLNFQLVLEIGAAISLPETYDYKIKITLGDWKWVSAKPMEKGQNYCRYNERFETTELKVPFKETSNIGKLFVYLMQDDHPVCYWKGSILDFLNPNPAMKWYPFTNDLAVGKVKEAHLGGLF